MFVESKMITDIYFSVGLTNNNQSVIPLMHFYYVQSKDLAPWL